MAKTKFVSLSNIIQDLKHTDSLVKGLVGEPRSKIANNLWAAFRTNQLLLADEGRTWKEWSWGQNAFHSGKSH